MEYEYRLDMTTMFTIHDRVPTKPWGVGQGGG